VDSTNSMFNLKRNKCLVCGTKLSLMKNIAITCINGAECPKCHSYMLFKKHICIIQIFIYFLIFPALKIFETQKILGILMLATILTMSIFLSVIAPYRIDPAHKSRINKNK